MHAGIGAIDDVDIAAVIRCDVVRLNNDAVPDLVVANAGSEDASVLFGNGDGTFRAPLNLDAGTAPQWVVAGDLNGDGISDFAVSDSLGASVAVLLSNGDGSFHARPSLLRGMPTWASVAGDFNGDGLSDLAVSDNIVPGAIKVMLSGGDGSLGEPIRTPLPGCVGECGPVALAVADFNRDGNLDCVVADANVGVVILLGNGDGTFRLAATVPVGRLGFNTAGLHRGEPPSGACSRRLQSRWISGCGGDKSVFAQLLAVARPRRRDLRASAEP